MANSSLDAISVGESDVLSYLRVQGDFAPALGDVVQRELTAQAAREAGLEVSDEELQDAFDNFRRAMGLEDAEDTEDWIAAHGLSLEELEDHIETNVLVFKWKNHLEQNADREKYLDSDRIQNTVRNMIYDEWLNEQLGE